MTEWIVIESNEKRIRWANYETMTEIRVTKLRERLHSVALLRTKEYGVRNKKPADVYVETVRGSREDDVARKVEWLRNNLENLLQGEENVTA